jgi:AraC-like DNA-binding protein
MSQGLTLDEIARDLDYKSLNSFSRAFRQWTETVPSEYRKVLDLHRFSAAS